MKKAFIFLGIFLLLSGLSACTLNEGEQDKQYQQSKEIENTEIIKEDIKNHSGDSWELSPTFEHTVKDINGEDISYKIIGKEGRIGFTKSPIIANKREKVIWFYWGNVNIYNKPVKIFALKKDSEAEPIEVFSGMFYKDAQVGPGSVNMPSNLEFPSEGIWKLFIYIDKKFYENIVIEAKD